MGELFPIPDEELVQRAVLCATADHPRPRYMCVADVFGMGSTLARHLCRRFDRDPDELVGKEKASS